jgi:hypothetical protein
VEDVIFLSFQATGDLLFSSFSSIISTTVLPLVKICLCLANKQVKEPAETLEEREEKEEMYLAFSSYWTTLNQTGWKKNSWIRSSSSSSSSLNIHRLVKLHDEANWGCS